MEIFIICVQLHTSFPREVTLCAASYQFPKGSYQRLLHMAIQKSNVAFYPTSPTTIKKEAQNNGPKEAVNSTSSSSRGVMNVSGAGQLPRNEHQVSNIKCLQKKQFSGAIDADDLFIAMTECKSQDITVYYVREVEAAPDPALVLGNDQQLNDLVQFCTGSEEFSIDKVDPTLKFRCDSCDVSKFATGNNVWGKLPSILRASVGSFLYKFLHFSIFCFNFN